MREGSPVRKMTISGVDSNIPGYITDAPKAIPTLVPVTEQRSPIQGPVNNPLDIDALISTEATLITGPTMRTTNITPATETRQPGQYPYPGMDRYTNLAGEAGNLQPKTEQADRSNPSGIDELIPGYVIMDDSSEIS